MINNPEFVSLFFVNNSIDLGNFKLSIFFVQFEGLSPHNFITRF
jgi:hypothetical protein